MYVEGFKCLVFAKPSTRWLAKQRAFDLKGDCTTIELHADNLISRVSIRLHQITS
jgi:hypothetical protein